MNKLEQLKKELTDARIHFNKMEEALNIARKNKDIAEKLYTDEYTKTMDSRDISKLKTNFVIATYNGINTREKIKFNKILAVLRQLEYYKTLTVQKYTIVVAEEQDTNKIDKEYDTFLTTIPSLFPTLPIEIIRKPNNIILLSYDSYCYAWEQDKTYDYYIFCEDDYFMSQMYYDEILIKMLNTHSFDYLFAHMESVRPFGLHASHAICFTKGSILEEVFNNYSSRMNEFYTRRKFPHQVAFTHLFFDFPKYKFEDLRRSRYLAVFYETSNNTARYLCRRSMPSTPAIIMPVQWYPLHKVDYPNGDKCI